jgi:hypothetical protein
MNSGQYSSPLGANADGVNSGNWDEFVYRFGPFDASPVSPAQTTIPERE